MNLQTITAFLAKYGPVIAAVATGVASIAMQHYSEGLAEILQALSLLSGGTAVASLRHAVHQVPDAVLEAARRS
jgi:hypothetical protein